MKIVFLGTCQLEAVGHLFERFAADGLIQAAVLWKKTFHELEATDFAPLEAALTAADRIYCQYNTLRYNDFSTDDLRRKYRVKMVPTLWSLVSVPQLGYWNDRTPLPPRVAYVDFRILELFLAGIDPLQAAKQYQAVNLNHDAIAQTVADTVATFAKRYQDGKVDFDYAPVYERAIAADIESFISLNHPKNVHFGWLLESLLKDCGFSHMLPVTLSGEIFSDWQVPSLRGSPTSVYRIDYRDFGTVDAVRSYYEFYATLDRARLVQELQSSSYHRLIQPTGQRADRSTALQAQRAAITRLTDEIRTHISPPNSSFTRL